MKQQKYISLKKTISLFVLISLLFNLSLSAPSYVIGVDLHDTFMTSDQEAFSNALEIMLQEEIEKNGTRAYDALQYLVHLKQLQESIPYAEQYAAILQKLLRDSRINVSGEGRYILETLAESYPFLRPFIFDILKLSVTANVKPDEKVVAIIASLKEQGYPIIVVSNIEYTAYNHMSQKYRGTFALFDYYFIPALAGPKNVTEHRDLFLKPQKEYYVKLRIFLDDNGYNDVPMIFIDDSKKNIESAENANVNIIGIHYTNPEQLQYALMQIGLFEK